MIREMNYAAGRAVELRLLRETGLDGRAPDTYEEFLLMTAMSPVRRREIPASALRRSP